MMVQGPPPDEIKNLFDSVAHGYDAVNDAMTMGLARAWRRGLAKWSGVAPGDAVLDCATGTGDLALEFKRRVGTDGRVVGTDFCQGMLDLAPPKARRRGLDVTFRQADVTDLPFADQEFNVSSIAYGIRNVADPRKGLCEMARVVKPGGAVMILETGDTPSLGLKTMMDFYIRKIVPRIGGLITGQRGAYEYLNRSSRGFPSRERFLDLMRSTEAFATVEHRVLFGGASFMYKGVVK